MPFQDHDIVVEDGGVLFRACVTAAALEALQRRAGTPLAAEALIADNRLELEGLAIAGFRSGRSDADAAPVSIDADDVHARLDACTGRSSDSRPRHAMARGLFRPHRHRPGS